MINTLLNDYILENQSEEDIRNNYIFGDYKLEDQIKYIILTKLNEVERRILLIYIDTGSLRKTAKLFNVSPSKIFYVIGNIKDKIKKYIR